jgi:hypothetical protein
MKLRTAKLHRRTIAPPPQASKAQPEADFTAEGSPPPGKVGARQPVLPGAEQAGPAHTVEPDGTTRGKR